MTNQPPTSRSTPRPTPPRSSRSSTLAVRRTRKSSCATMPMKATSSFGIPPIPSSFSRRTRYPPYDRDRFLPVPPIPLEAHAGWLPGDDDPSENDEPDPLDLAGADDEIAAAKPESIPGTPPSDQLDSALEAQLRASEPENWTPPAQQFAEQNIPLLPPAEITDETLTLILWELLHNLALRGFYVLHTEHLSDRELHAELWGRGLRDPAHLPGRNRAAAGFTIFSAVGAKTTCNSGCATTLPTRSAPNTRHIGRRTPFQRKKSRPSTATGGCLGCLKE